MKKRCSLFRRVVSDEVKRKICKIDTLLRPELAGPAQGPSYLPRPRCQTSAGGRPPSPGTTSLTF